MESDFGAWVQSRIDQGQFVDFLDLPPDEPFEPDEPPPEP